ncbi:MAG TPA: sigma factor-like helix-turn-helix DNA-binding protein [Terriglobales bacterium]|nr:sigma factor-like helix-turn-helix DNA-binding protein [Terriglobales bacterium]
MPTSVHVPAGELRLYRSHTLGLLRRYFRMSLELGRLPSLIGREIFRARVSSYRAASFEDLVIFVTDIEHCLARLSPRAQQVVARIVFQEYTFDEAADLLRWPRRTMARQYFAALDRLTLVLLECGLLRPFVFHENPCQAPKIAGIGVNACADGEYSLRASGTNAPCKLLC